MVMYGGCMVMYRSIWCRIYMGIRCCIELYGVV